MLVRIQSDGLMYKSTLSKGRIKTLSHAHNIKPECWYCKSTKNLTREHIGSLNRNLIVFACYDCNHLLSVVYQCVETYYHRINNGLLHRDHIMKLACTINIVKNSRIPQPDRDIYLADLQSLMSHMVQSYDSSNKSK